MVTLEQQYSNIVASRLFGASKCSDVSCGCETASDDELTWFAAESRPTCG